MTKKVYLCSEYSVSADRMVPKFILSTEEEANRWVDRNPEYLRYTVYDVMDKPDDT